MNAHKLLLSVLLFLTFASLAASQTAPEYQKGTITPVLSSRQKSYELKTGATGYQIANCGEFQDGQVVDYIVKDNKVLIRLNGAEYKCSIKGRYSPTVGTLPGPRTYLKGTIQGYGIRYRISKGSTGGVRRAKVYDLVGPDLIYEIDFCGAFQAGEFTTGQTVDFRVEDERLYILHDVNKEYSCQIEGTLKPGEAKPKEEEPPAPAAAGAKLSITSLPDGADIEIDGNFSGNTPSDLAVPEGGHTITVKKTGYKNWERQMKLAAGSNIHLNAELEKAPNP